MATKTKKIVIGLTGQKGAGKGAFIKILDELLPRYSVERVSSGALLGELLKLAGKPLTRDNLQKIPVALEDAFGKGIVSNMVRREILKSNADIVIFDGVRWPSDVQMLRKLNAIIVYITANPDVRYERTRVRGEKTGENTASFNEFVAQESAPTETGINSIGEQDSDFYIRNDGTVDDLRRQVRTFINHILGIVAMRRVILETPYAGDIERNIRYARECMRDCLLRGEAPYASHLLYTQEGVLDDNSKEERKLGIEAGFLWREPADATVVYSDHGISGGMQLGIEDAEQKGRPVEYRRLYLDSLEDEK